MTPRGRHAESHRELLQHGQDVALRALPIVRRHCPRARLLVVGAPNPRAVDKEFAASLPELAQQLGIADDVVFAGAVEEMADVYAAADVVLNPVRTAESFGRVMAEALVAGTPVVASRVGAVPEVIRDEVDALLIQPDDPVRLAGAAVRILQDEELSRRLVVRGQERVRTTFGFEQDLAAWIEVFDAIVPASQVAYDRVPARSDAREPRPSGPIARNP